MPPDASDRHFNYVTRTKGVVTKIRFTSKDNIAANTLAFAELMKTDTKARAAARMATMRSATIFALPFLATGLTA